VLATNPVLLVEDNDELRSALARLLRLRGYRVVETRDGQEAWEYLQRGATPSVIVLDLILPRLDGRLLRAKLLEHDEYASIPVIVFTADQGEALPNVTAFLRKPNPQPLLDLIDETAVPVLK
jgi:CheY-like chemotaxis protein